MSFEDSLQTRLTMGHSDPPETDLDYYAKPENYAGSNIFAMQRVAMAWKKQEENTPEDNKKRQAHEKAVERILERYNDVGVFRPQSTGLGPSAVPPQPQPRSISSHHLRAPVVSPLPSAAASSMQKRKKRRKSLSDQASGELSDSGSSTCPKGERPTRVRRPSRRYSDASDSDSDISVHRKLSITPRVSGPRASSVNTVDSKEIKMEMLLVSEDATWFKETIKMKDERDACEPEPMADSRPVYHWMAIVHAQKLTSAFLARWRKEARIRKHIPVPDPVPQPPPEKKKRTRPQKEQTRENNILAHLSAAQKLRLANRHKNKQKNSGILAAFTHLVEAQNGHEGGQIKAKGAKERFKHATKVVLILLKWISSLTEKSGDSGNSEATRQAAVDAKTFTDIANEVFISEDLKNSGLSFDVSQFKAKKEINISNEVKQILGTPKAVRTPEQLQLVLYGLQHLKSFAEYPLHMQEKLCKVAWFQQVPPKRVIIRQGHYAENFYFILSGQAVVRILDKNPKTGEVQLRTAAVMRKGTSFGELALLHHSRRTATVVSQDHVQLLTIGRDDFFDIFMSGQAPGQIPDHISFVSGLEFMRDWPIDQLLDHPECCLFHFFKRGVVIVKDSTKSDWIYIIKSGSCKVIKQLKGVLPQMLRSKSDLSDLNKSLSTKLPKLGSGDAEPRVNTGLKKSGMTSKSCPSSLSQYNHILKMQELSRSKEAAKQSEDSRTYLKVPTRENLISPEPPESDNSGLKLDSKEKICTSPVLLTEATTGGKAAVSKSRYHFLPKTKSPHLVSCTSKTPAPPPTIRVSSAGKSPLTRPKSRPTQKTEPLPPGAGSGPVFVQMELLKPRDVFGLNTVTFDDDIERTSTIVSLVSNGAECIMLSKKFFMDHSNELVKRMIRQQIRPYPTEDSLQENLQIKVDWDLYKRHMIKDVMMYNRKVSEYANGLS